MNRYWGVAAAVIVAGLALLFALPHRTTGKPDNSVAIEYRGAPSSDIIYEQDFVDVASRPTPDGDGRAGAVFLEPSRQLVGADACRVNTTDRKLGDDLLV